MPLTEIPVTMLDRIGTAPPAQTDSDMTNGMFVDTLDATMVIEIENTDSVPRTVGFTLRNNLIDGVTVGNKVVTVTNGAIAWVGGFPLSLYRQSDGTLLVNPEVDTLIKFRAYIPASS